MCRNKPAEPLPGKGGLSGLQKGESISQNAAWAKAGGREAVWPSRTAQELGGAEVVVCAGIEGEDAA